MKKFTLTILAVAGVSFSGYAQLGGLMQKAAGMTGQAKALLPKSSSAATPATTTPAPAAAPAATPAPAAAPAATATTPAPAAAPAPVVSSVVADKPIEGVISPAHARNVGRIVFATTEEALAGQAEKETAFITTYTIGEPLFARAYMANSLRNVARKMDPEAFEVLVNGTSTYQVNVYLDGKLAGGSRFDSGELGELDRMGSTVAFPLKNSTGGSGSLLYNLEMNNRDKLGMGGGTHQGRIELVPVMSGIEGPAVATGDLVLEARPAPVHVISKTCLPAAVLQNAALEAKVLQAFKAKGWPEIPKAVRITRDWRTVRNEYTGIITKRTLTATIGSTNNGECRHQSFLFAQDYNGSSYQGAIYLDGVGADEFIRCECLK